MQRRLVTILNNERDTAHSTHRHILERRLLQKTTVTNEEGVELRGANSPQIYALRRIVTVRLPAQATDHSHNPLQILLRHQRTARQTEPPVEEPLTRTIHIAWCLCKDRLQMHRLP